MPSPAVTQPPHNHLHLLFSVGDTQIMTPLSLWRMTSHLQLQASKRVVSYHKLIHSCLHKNNLEQLGRKGRLLFLRYQDIQQEIERSIKHVENNGNPLILSRGKFSKATCSYIFDGFVPSPVKGVMTFTLTKRCWSSQVFGSLILFRQRFKQT